MGPYDNLIRYLWQNMERVEAELRAALPSNLTSQLDFTSLERWPSTTVDARLTRREGDALFSVSLAGREALLYVLLEHQSSEDRFMALRVLIYMTRIWEQWR